MTLLRTLAAVCAATLPLQAQHDLVRCIVRDATPGQRLQLQQHFDLTGNCCGGPRTTGPVDIVLPNNRLALLRAIAPQAELVSDGRPWSAIELERGVAGEDPDLSYYTVAEVEAEIDALVAAHPAHARKVDLSALPGAQLTHEGRRIFALKVSDDVALDEDEPAMVLAAQHHARELNSPHMVLRAMQRVLADRLTDPAIGALVDSHELWFVPMVNPDGVNTVWTTNSLWRKNRRNNGASYGVDLNRNYPFLWGLCGASTTASSETYRGPSAGSEPETVTMRALVSWLRPEVYLDFHSHGQDVLRMWAPCATVNPQMQAFQQSYCDRLRTPMGYATRDPSASGEAPEDHYSSGGTLAFLVEVGTDFQPPFVDTIAEEARVWPGVREALTTWRPALRGHVRSALGSAPLEAVITFQPSVLLHGEVTRSRVRDGRYGLWLPVGSWTVTFSAAGHASRTLSVTVTTLDQPQLLDVHLEPAGSVPTMVRAGAGGIGTSVTFTYRSPGDSGKQVLFGWSLGTTPGIPLGGQRVLPLNHDFLFDAALVGNPVLAPTWNVLDAASEAQCVLSIPADPWLVGIRSHVAGITVDPAFQHFIKCWSTPVAVTILP